MYLFVYINSNKPKKMKKLMMLVAVATFALAATSCTKDYTCSCSAAGLLPAQDYPYSDVKKADAEDACDVVQTSRKLADAAATCELK